MEAEKIKTAKQILLKTLLNTKSVPPAAQFTIKEWDIVNEKSPEFVQAIIKAMEEYASQFKQPPVSVMPSDVFTHDQVEQVVKDAMTTTMNAMLEWFEKETEIVDLCTGKVLPNTEIRLIPKPKSTLDYIYPKLKEKGITVDLSLSKEAPKEPMRPSCMGRGKPIQNDLGEWPMQNKMPNKERETAIECLHEFVAKEYPSQPYGTCTACGQTIIE